MMEEPPDVESVLVKLESTLPICRVCLDISMEYIEFEGPLCVVNGQEITYSDALNELSSPISDLPEKSPTNFCVTCGQDLLNAYMFLKRVENANFILSKAKFFAEDNCDRKDKELISDQEPNCTKNLKVEICPYQHDNEFNKFIDFEVDSKSMLNSEGSYKCEDQSKSESEFDFKEPCKSKLISNQHEQLQFLIESNTKTQLGSDDDENTIDSEIPDENKVWMCDECGAMCDSEELLAAHTEKHKLNVKSTNMCVHCNKIFPTLQHLDDHLLFHEYSKLIEAASDKMVHQCTLCEKTCRSEIDFIDHINVHRGNRPHVCTICSNTFHTKHNLRLHKWRVHNNHELMRRKGKEYEKCRHCQRIIKVSHMERHMGTHTAKREFACNECGKQFLTKFGLKTHSATHKQREFTCHICNKVCLTEFTLRKHIQFIHLSDRKKYQCEDCGLVFQYPSYLKDHQRKHNTKNRFQCPHCERSYCRKPQLDIHLRYHNNDFRYKCDQCDKCYVTKSNLTDHIKSRHTHITYDCDKCNQKFKSLTGLRKHKYTHTGYPYICPLCSVGQTSRSGMKAHIFGVHRDVVTEEEFNEMFPIIIPKSGYRRPKP